MRINDHFKISDKLKTARTDKGYSQRAMAIELKLSFSTYSQTENQLTAHLTLDIANAQLSTFIPDWNNVNQEYKSGMMDDNRYKMWKEDILARFNISINDYL